MDSKARERWIYSASENLNVGNFKNREQTSDSVKKKEYLCPVCGNVIFVNWWSHYGKQYVSASKN